MATQNVYGEKVNSMARKQDRISNDIPPSRADDFRAIRGIGPILSSRIHKSGIQTYNELASMSPVNLAARVTGLSTSQIIRQDWIGQARKLSSKKAQSKVHKKVAVVPPIRQHYENFTIEFLLDEKKEARRTRIVHIQSGDADTWNGWEEGMLNDFLLRHTGIRILQSKLDQLTPVQQDDLEFSSNICDRKEVRIPDPLPTLPALPKLENPVAIATDSVFESQGTINYNSTLKLQNLIVTLPDSDVPIFFLRQGQPFTVQLTIDHGKVASPGKTPPTYKATIVYKQLGGYDEFTEETSNTLSHSDSTSIKTAGTNLNAGIYRLSTIVKIVSDQVEPGRTAYLKGDLLEVY
jgi:predicted flap endonuclease-1-like 5' DNA nuclease